MREATVAVEMQVKEMCGGRATATQRGWLCTTRAAKFTHSLATGGSFAGVEATRQEAGNEKAFVAFCLFLSVRLVLVPSLHFRPVDPLGSSPETVGV